jgi:hypothetical protein
MYTYKCMGLAQDGVKSCALILLVLNARNRERKEAVVT